MDRKDVILSAVFAKVEDYFEPEDHPTPSSEIATDINLPLNDILALCEELVDDGFLAISQLHTPPLLYLTLTGVARARRMDAASFMCHKYPVNQSL